MKKNICIVGGGPAGMIAGVLLARSGHKVTVLEKNDNFDREFRGEVLQPRFMRAIKQAGLLTVIEQIACEHFHELKLFSSGKVLGKIDIGKSKTEFPYITWMSQPNLLNALAKEAQTYENFKLIFSARVDQLKWKNETCVGLRYTQHHQPYELESDLVIGADGRFSVLRDLGKFELAFHSYRFDVLWFHTKRPESFNHGVDFFINRDLTCLTLPKYPDLIQCGILAEVGQGRALRKQGIDAVSKKLISAHPMFSEFAENLKAESDFTVLQAKIERVKDWAKDGIVLIGDAAHTCSPIFAVGVSIAAETAICAAKVIDEAQDCTAASLQAIQLQRQKAVLEIHNRQEAAAKFGVLNPFGRKLAPYLIPLALKTGIPQKIIVNVLSAN